MSFQNSYWFPHDYDAHADLKIRALIKKYGLEGYGRWWVVVEQLASQEDYRLKRCSWVIEALAEAMRCETDETEAFLDDCIQSFELLASDGEAFWSESLMRRMQAREAKKQVFVEAGKKGAKKRWDSQAIATLLGGQKGANGVRWLDSTDSTDSTDKEGVTPKAENEHSLEDHEDKVKTFFEAYWQREPRKEGKKAAFEAFKENFPATLSREQLNIRLQNFQEHFDIREADAEEKFFEGEGRFVSKPANWIRSNDFDEPPEDNTEGQLFEPVGSEDGEDV